MIKTKDSEEGELYIFHKNQQIWLIQNKIRNKHLYILDLHIDWLK